MLKPWSLAGLTQAAFFMSSSTVKRPPPTWLRYKVRMRAGVRVRVGVGTRVSFMVS